MLHELVEMSAVMGSELVCSGEPQDIPQFWVIFKVVEGKTQRFKNLTIFLLKIQRTPEDATVN